LGGTAVRGPGGSPERACPIAELLDSGARIVDVADVLGMTRTAVQDARDRAREQ
jgi:hypothetical protein